MVADAFPRKTALVIGAGASGRGHVGQLAAESGYRLVLLDKDKALCRALRAAGAYTVRLVSAHTRVVTVDGFTVLHTSEQEAFFAGFRDAGLVFTTVCPGNLTDAADHLRPFLVRWLQSCGPDEFKNVLCCENMNRSSTTFRDMLLEGFPAELRPKLERQVGFSDTMIARVVAKPADPLVLLGEEYSEWTADRKAIRGPVLPAVRTLELVDDQDRYLQRKLYIHNAGHATFGYLGFLKGYRWLHEAGQDPEIMDACRKAIEESGWAIQREFGFSEDVIRTYRAALTDKCVSPELPDEILRVVREPIRKLGREERFFGPIGLMLKHGRQPEHILAGVCGALLARIPGDGQSERIASLLERKGIACLDEITGSAVAGPVRARIEAMLPVVRARFARTS
jgi:mannitol-1-phosphate 5-dehydrogenase